MRDERFMEFIHADVTSSATGDAGVEAAEIHMPVSENENLACLIHRVDFLVNMLLTADLAAATNIWRGGSLNTFPAADHADMLIGVPGCLAMYIWGATTSAAGVLSNQEGERAWLFDPPLLIARRQLYVAAYRSVGVANDTNCRINIGYTVEKVSKDAFIAALVGAR